VLSPSRPMTNQDKSSIVLTTVICQVV
jgi:hypothetical protein